MDSKTTGAEMTTSQPTMTTYVFDRDPELGNEPDGYFEKDGLVYVTTTDLDALEAGVEPIGIIETQHQITCNCAEGNHRTCGGYIAPLLNSDQRPCTCVCHGGEPRIPMVNNETVASYNARVAAARCG